MEKIYRFDKEEDIEALRLLAYASEEEHGDTDSSEYEEDISERSTPGKIKCISNIWQKDYKKICLYYV